MSKKKQFRPDKIKNKFVQYYKKKEKLILLHSSHQLCSSNNRKIIVDLKFRLCMFFERRGGPHAKFLVIAKLSFFQMKNKSLKLIEKPLFFFKKNVYPNFRFYKISVFSLFEYDTLF